MNYQECIDYLYEKLPMFSRTGDAALKLNLDNTWSLCRFLHMPQERFPTVHIAGTNGKGSVSHLLASIFQEAGYKTGLYTSPHLKDFRERIKIDGKLIAPEQVVETVKLLQPLINEIEPSFFEVTVAMAFHHFAKEEVDIAIIETGLGGRLDSTNVIHPLLSIITNIGLDHVNILGTTHESIAKEKAGIIKPNVPVIIGSTQEKTKDVFLETAKRNESEITFADFICESKITNQQPDSFETPLSGVYQQENIRTVFLACKKLKELGWNINDQSLQRGIKQVITNTGFHGRWEVIQKKPVVVLDVAHNKEGMGQVLEQIARFSFKRIFMVVGLSSDKDVEGILNLLPTHFIYGFTQANLPRALPKEHLAQKAHARGLNGIVFEDVNEGLQHFRKIAHAEDLIVVCGSIFVVGEVER
jgi:dihydrofolate synthase/folylpolyglutamate synthase